MNLSIKNDIRAFMKFIYDYTNEKSELSFIYINNINELLSLITFLLLTSREPTIKLRINERDYEISNIKVHPYSSCSINSKLPIRIQLSKIEAELMEHLLTSYKYRDLLKVLANEFYYLNLDFRIKKEYSFCINQEIMDFLRMDEHKDENLINFSFYEYLPLSSYKSLRIIRANFDKIAFAINYSILLTSSIYTEVSINNYLSLIYLYFFLLKNNYSLPFLSFLKFIKVSILIMKSKLKLDLDIHKFMELIINFKANPFITKMKINEIDMNFITELFEFKGNPFSFYEDTNEFYEDLNNSLNHFMNTIVIPNIDNEDYRDDLIKLQYIYLLPVLQELSLPQRKINTIAFQREMLKIKALDLLSRLGLSRKTGGALEELQGLQGLQRPQGLQGTTTTTTTIPIAGLPRDPTRDPTRNLTTEEPIRELTRLPERARISTDNSLDMQTIIKKLQVIGEIQELMDELKIETIEEKFYKKLLDLSKIPSIKENSLEPNNIYDTTKILDELQAKIKEDVEKQEEKRKDINVRNDDNRQNPFGYASSSYDKQAKVSPEMVAIIDKMITNIDKNLSKVNDELSNYGVQQSTSSSSTIGNMTNAVTNAVKNVGEFITGSSERKKLDKMKEKIGELKETLKLLANLRDSENQELRAILKDFKIIMEEKELVNLIVEPKTIVDDFDDFVRGMDRVLEIYVKILNELKTIYTSLKGNIRNTRSGLGIKEVSDTNRDRTPWNWN